MLILLILKKTKKKRRRNGVFHSPLKSEFGAGNDTTPKLTVKSVKKKV